MRSLNPPSSAHPSASPATRTGGWMYFRRGGPGPLSSRRAVVARSPSRRRSAGRSMPCATSKRKNALTKPDRISDILEPAYRLSGPAGALPLSSWLGHLLLGRRSDQLFQGRPVHIREALDVETAFAARMRAEARKQRIVGLRSVERVQRDVLFSW